MNKLTPIIGLEIHLQLNTKSKVFCGCSARTWETKPNTHTCPVCLGLPGAMPVLNKSAFEYALKMALALNCKLNETTYFERKNYFYPDLPKGFQISQKRAPLGENGRVKTPQGEFGIWEVHLEEDTAKSVHTSGGTLLDFNKSGIPLLEIVSAPEINSVNELNSFAKEIREIALALGISNCDMEKGEMRFEANVSISKQRSADSFQQEQNSEGGGGGGGRPACWRGRNAEHGMRVPSYRVEIKNLNSFKYLRDAVAYEIERQTELIEKDEEPIQETRGWDPEKGKTYAQRTKEEAHDYRYFPEPDLPKIQLTANSNQPSAGKIDVKEIKKELPELPEEKREKYKELGLKESQAEILARDRKRENYFLQLREHIDFQEAAKLVINHPEVMEKDPETVVHALQKEEEQTISKEEKLEKIAQEVIEENPEPVADYKNGKEAALQFLLGKVMQKTQGKADPQSSLKILKQQLS